jgi:hypothetical protein
MITTTTKPSSIPNINMNGNFYCSIRGRTAMTSGTWSTPKRMTVIQNLPSVQKSRNPMIGNTMATPAANTARPQWREWSKKPSSSPNTMSGPLMGQTSTLFRLDHLLSTGTTHQNPSQTPPNSSPQSLTVPSRSMASLPPSRRYRQYRDAATEYPPQIPSGTWQP